mmetsp:Transcript_2632/g.2943  ORF Transcript_2632/g.2943 Transcript_2632/m.2943 type:complete len:165 (-) Transcript_2632:452-946(-)|eukprot:CAMPEP_0197856438 /NCGR_PEP_ID=MMETSP1438-20131217/28573_1 /TAXON_ID=1461541 /ORGANISM="Pterosperma sp., Strain CCMP1384" /LENGTH=164 /DNA_ID=CAMNT_0043471891 /DNA_START=305 /DNA_END=799 /DNA_ORIENTATION=+
MSTSTSSHSSTLSREQLAQLKAVFTYFDTDHDGLLTVKDAQHVARLIGSRSDVFDGAPKDKKIDLSEFVHLIEAAERVDDVQGSKTPFHLAVSKMYRGLDVGDVGYATQDKIQAFFHTTGDNIKPRLISALVNDMDHTLDGERFTEEELKIFLKKRAEKGDFVY